MLGGASSFTLSSTHFLSSPMKKMEAIKPMRSNREFFGVKIKANFFNPSDERILKQALEIFMLLELLEHEYPYLEHMIPLEPVAFMGGIFAGILRLNLNEDPLKEWVTRTVEASGITEEEIDAPDSETEEIPQQIEIE